VQINKERETNPTSPHHFLS